ncbi:hypothetical protein C0991_010919 [Blastosporella zonata]|nr:hypothetical protein C0991_010919 [Blastosporella zonata]
MGPLLHSLRSSAQDGQHHAYGRWVRRLELSVIEHEDPLRPITPTDILRHCRNVEVLVKYDDDLLPHSLEGVDLTKIKRLDWWYAWYRDGSHQFDTQEDDHSRGVDFLHQVLRRAPHLQYLSLGKRYGGPDRRDTAHLCLPSLTTLRLESIPRQMCSNLEQWHLPNLHNLIMDASPVAFPFFHTLFNDSSVRVVELLDDIFFLDQEIISFIFTVAPNLQELSYYIEFSQPPSNTPSHLTLNCIRLHSKVNTMAQYSTWSTGQTDSRIWEVLKEHFAVFKRSNFPSLHRIVLHGDWAKRVNDPRFRPLSEALHTENIHLELDGC